MKCPECAKEGRSSLVYPGGSMSTAMWFPPFYDAEGRLHCHDGNTVTTDYTCSNGHAWTDETRGSCWCGWRAGAPHKQPTEFLTLYDAAEEAPK